MTEELGKYIPVFLSSRQKNAVINTRLVLKTDYSLLD